MQRAAAAIAQIAEQFNQAVAVALLRQRNAVLKAKQRVRDVLGRPVVDLACQSCSLVFTTLNNLGLEGQNPWIDLSYMVRQRRAAHLDLSKQLLDVVGRTLQ